MTPQEQSCYAFGAFRLYPDARVLRRDGKSLDLYPKDFDVLVYLVLHRHRVVRSRELIDQLWPDTSVQKGNLTTNISNIRKVLGDDARSPTYIETVTTIGYRFKAEVGPCGDEAGVGEGSVEDGLQSRDFGGGRPGVGTEEEISSARRAVTAAQTEPDRHESVYLVRSYDELLRTLLVIVEEAEQILVNVGSRSRDKKFLDAIENKLKGYPSLVHYRVLFGEPHNQILKEHLLRLLELRDPADRTHGRQTICIGLFLDYLREPERHVCANENKALVVLPSVNGVGEYDTALVIQSPPDVQAILRYVHELYNASTAIETTADVNKLPLRRPPDSTRGL